MKVEIKGDYGIEITPENKEEHKILERFWDGGVKISSRTGIGQLQLTFADLIEEEEEHFDKKTLAKIDTFAKEMGITRSSAVKYCIDSVLIDTFGKQFVHIKRDTNAPICNYMKG